MSAVATRPLAGQFAPPEILERAHLANRAQVDSLDFGFVKVDDTGKILLYNRYEGEMGGNNAAICEGKNFFTEVAPCTNNALFFGQFKKGIAANNLNLLFPYTFTYKLKPTNVKVHMFRDPETKTNVVLVKTT
jgi:photoactive yellow protein